MHNNNKPRHGQGKHPMQKNKVNLPYATEISKEQIKIIKRR